MSLGEVNNWPPSLANELYQVLLRRIPPEVESPHLEDVVAVLIFALSQGELTFDFDADDPEIELKGSDWPRAHREALLSSGWVNGDSSPLILDGSRIAWRRWYQELNIVVEELLNRSKKDPLRRSLDIEESLPTTLNKEQSQAVEAIDENNLVLISGGPGTGKTSTIVQILLRSLSRHPRPRVAISAPTGKAARRIQDSIRKTIKSLTYTQQELLSSLTCSTLHKLLEAGKGGFNKNRNNKLPLELLVIDEMSMVDLDLMSAVLNALPSSCQLILVGDPDQLPPIGSGSIWHWIQTEGIIKRFKQCSVHLHRVYRNDGDLESLSRVLREGGLALFFQQISDLANTPTFTRHLSNPRVIPDALTQKLNAHIRRLELFAKQLAQSASLANNPLTIDDPNTLLVIEECLSSLENLLVLSPRRKGLWGVEHVHKHVLGKSYEEGLSSWPEGFPVMCGKNQPELGLANGDIGLIVGNNNTRRLLFRLVSDQGKMLIRLIHPARVLVLEPALAITIHKSQGSESKHVIILWPEDLNDKSQNSVDSIKKNESYKVKLLYTAITRASQKVDLFNRRFSLGSVK